jgi:uncharacterized protein YdeI (YjbR/CyaY-like superfamily)
MNVGKTLYVTTRREWRAWLKKHALTEPEIWLIFYKKESGIPRISYDDAVLEALAFGWIDSIVKKRDSDSFVQRFSPRKPSSNLSQMNKERVTELIKQKKMTPAGLAAIAHAYDPKKDASNEVVIPPDILKALKANPEAWRHFQKFSTAYQRIRIDYIESRKRHSPELYQKALAHFVDKTAQNKRIGFVPERKI